MSGDTTAATGCILRVPRESGTPGDDLVAWGLARVVSTVGKQNVVIRSVGDHFALESALAFEELLTRACDAAKDPRLALPWLASKEKQKYPPSGISDVRQRDSMREEYKRAHEAHEAQKDIPQADDGPPFVFTVEGADIYPLFRVLTSPGTQWSGYNSFAEIVQKYIATPAGIALILHLYHTPGQRVDQALRDLGVGSRGDRWRNPPGFLYPGLNKGPTMRMTSEGGLQIGKLGEADWQLADRGDRDALQLYLAYLGYFEVARVADSDEGRVVLVPSPATVAFPAVRSALRSVSATYSTVADYLTASTALRYGRAALDYWEQFPGGRWTRDRQVLLGVHVSLYWKPNPQVFAPHRQVIAPIPAWLPALTTQTDIGTARDTLALHSRRITNLRGPWRDENKLAGESRDALAAYVASLDGSPRSWLEAVCRWFPAARRAESQRTINLWRTDEVRRILMTLDPDNDILRIIQSDSFRHLAGAIRNSTVHPHYDRLKGGREGGNTSSFDVDYDLVTTLSEAAQRHPVEFLSELYRFVARYNDETMRRNDDAARKGQHRRPMVREDDLERVSQWVQADRHGLVPAALIAFGTSLPPKNQADSELQQDGILLAGVSESD